MQTKTECIAPVSLWLVVRKRFQRRGLLVEPAWVGANGKAGPAFFVSRILAEVYAHLRNKHYGEDESSNWRVIPLQAFDLLEHARGTDGPMQCMLAFGFAMQDAETVICSNCPRLRMVSFPYSVRRDAQTVTFSFHPSIFDLMEEEWASIGLPHFAKELHCTDELDAASFDRLLQTAIGSLKVCRTPETDGDGLWAVFSMQRGQWISGSNMDVAVSRSLH